MAIPSAPTNLVATTVSSSKINLTWKNPAPFDIEISIERRAYGGTYSVLDTIPGTDTSEVDATCADGTLYYYRIRGHNEFPPAGYSGYSNVANATTTLPAPTSLAGTANSATQITLTWSDNSDNETGFLVYMKQSGGTYSLITTTAANIETYAKTGLATNTKYFFYVRATNSHITSGYSNVIALSTLTAISPVTLSNTGHQDILIIDTVNKLEIKPPDVTTPTVDETDVLTITYDVVATDGAVCKIDTTHADNGYPFPAYIRTKDLDFTDQHPDIAGMIKTIRRFRVIYEDIDADTPFTCYISNDGGINWDMSSATVGVGDGRAKAQDFYFMNSEYVTGLNHTFKLDCLSITKTFLWLAFEIDFFVRGEHFNV